MKDRVFWLALNGLVSGKVEEDRGEEFLVRLDNGKSVIVNKESIKDEPFE